MFYNALCMLWFCLNACLFLYLYELFVGFWLELLVGILAGTNDGILAGIELVNCFVDFDRNRCWGLELELFVEFWLELFVGILVGKEDGDSGWK